MYIYFFLSGLINFIASVLFGTLVFRRGDNKKVNLTFSFFCFAVALWSLGYMFWPLSETREGTLFWFQFLHIGASFTSITYFHFVVVWLKKENIANKILIFFGYLLAIFFASQTFLPSFIADMVPKFSMRFWAVPGYLYKYYLLYFFGFSLYASILLLLNYLKLRKDLSDKRRNQIMLTLVGMALAFIGGSTNYLLWFDINFPPFGNILVCSYVVLTAYAIVKYQLFNIKLIMAQFLTVAIWILIFSQLFFAENTSSYILASLTLVFAIVFGIFLIKSVQAEVQRKEELQIMSDKLAKNNDQLRKLDNAKSEFISIASHQLRTPLTAIKGFLSLMLEGSYGKLSKEHEDVINKVYASSERLISLVEDLLNISRIESGRMEYKFDKWDVVKLCQEVVDTFVLKAKDKNLYLEFKDPKGDFPEIETDGGKLREVISNLVDNALKYTQRGGVSVRLSNEGTVIRIIVSDTGIGIPAEELPYLFSKFSRGKDTSRLNTGGTGLGLFVGKSMVEALGGKVWAESEGAGKGSRFIIEVPIKKDKKK